MNIFNRIYAFIRGLTPLIGNRAGAGRLPGLKAYKGVREYAINLFFYVV